MFDGFVRRIDVFGEGGVQAAVLDAELFAQFEELSGLNVEVVDVGGAHVGREPSWIPVAEWIEACDGHVVLCGDLEQVPGPESALDHVSGLVRMQ
jgi:hypothetical protein